MSASTLPSTRRRFLAGTAAAGAGLALSPLASANALAGYGGPNVILARFGGGVRRRETIVPEHTYAPYLLNELAKRGTLYTDMVIDTLKGVETSHGQGTLFILTGKYDDFGDQKKGLSEQFEARVPTLFEYLRGAFDVPEHQALIINGEDRTQEEFYSFSNHHLFGAKFRSEALSLYRFKVHLLRRQIAEGKFQGKELAEKQKQLQEMESKDYREGGQRSQSEPIQEFWDRWRAHYGESGLRNPRGDRLLTELTLWAMKHLRPKLLMVNYNDPDYVHWGNLSHYTRGISVIDEGLKQLVTAVELDPNYRDNTVFVIVPDCGRDNNPFLDVPCQHHFNSKSAHEIWALLIGPGIEKGLVVDKRVHQISVAATIGKIMGMETKFAEGPVLEEAFV